MRSPGIHWISASDPPHAFPDASLALKEPDGLLAAGGDLSPDRLLYAYRHGIFPWYENGQPVLWWSPDPRCVLLPDAFRLSARNRRALRRSGFSVAFNSLFVDVVRGCAEPRPGQHGTWITDDMLTAYTRLHDAGWAHSVEVRRDGRLAGGLYGLGIGRVFFGESMFSREANASKLALAALCWQLRDHDCPLMDCQVESPHLLSLGATRLPRADFIRRLKSACYPVRPMTFFPATAIAATDIV